MLFAHRIAFLVYVHKRAARVFGHAVVLRICKEDVYRIGQKLFDEFFHSLVVFEISVDTRGKIKLNRDFKSEILSFDGIVARLSARNRHDPRLHVFDLIILILQIAVEKRRKRIVIGGRSELLSVAVIHFVYVLDPVSDLNPFKRLAVFGERVQLAEQIACRNEIDVVCLVYYVVEIVFFAEFAVDKVVGGKRLRFLRIAVHAERLRGRQFDVSYQREEIALRKIFCAEHIDDRLDRLGFDRILGGEVYRNDLVDLCDNVINLCVDRLHKGDRISVSVLNGIEIVDQSVDERLMFFIHIVYYDLRVPRLLIGEYACGHINRIGKKYGDKPYRLSHKFFDICVDLGIFKQLVDYFLFALFIGKSRIQSAAKIELQCRKNAYVLLFEHGRLIYDHLFDGYGVGDFYAVFVLDLFELIDFRQAGQGCVEYGGKFFAVQFQHLSFKLVLIFAFEH